MQFEQIAFGGLLHNASVTWLGGFSESSSSSYALFAELLSIKHGLLLTWDLGYHHVVCESDTLDVVKIL